MQYFIEPEEPNLIREEIKHEIISRDTLIKPNVLNISDYIERCYSFKICDFLEANGFQLHNDVGMEKISLVNEILPNSNIFLNLINTDYLLHILDQLDMNKILHVTVKHDLNYKLKIRIDYA